MPRFIQRLYPERIWAFSRSSNSVYLTFDDGPIPEVTPWVLDELKKHNAKATFFCIGENVQKHPEIFRRIIAEGHAVGNHTFNHLKGTKTETREYVENVEKARRQMIDDGSEKMDNSKTSNQQSAISNQQSLFRPPYGKITSKQAKILQQKGFKIVMWDIISYDFDATISEEKCLQNVLKNIRPGSVLVFHDSLKAEKNLRYVLPKILEFLTEKQLSSQAFNVLP
jgi:peptidoglycan/xylan/chitin deacetylase (PgdA/CDA1 family)